MNVGGSTRDPGRAAIRRYSLDEIPNLMNVIKGDLSLIGPRPALPMENASGQLDRNRLLVKPGVAGLWQITVDLWKVFRRR
ncbi:hypothetical protein GCM10027610_056340 [Dactylosporangium cerinum]